MPSHEAEKKNKIKIKKWAYFLGEMDLFKKKKNPHDRKATEVTDAARADAENDNARRRRPSLTFAAVLFAYGTCARCA